MGFTKIVKEIFGYSEEKSMKEKKVSKQLTPEARDKLVAVGAFTREELDVICPQTTQEDQETDISNLPQENPEQCEETTEKSVDSDITQTSATNDDRPSEVPTCKAVQNDVVQNPADETQIASIDNQAESMNVVAGESIGVDASSKQEAHTDNSLNSQSEVTEKTINEQDSHPEIKNQEEKSVSLQGDEKKTEDELRSNCETLKNEADDKERLLALEKYFGSEDKERFSKWIENLRKEGAYRSFEDLPKIYSESFRRYLDSEIAIITEAINKEILVLQHKFDQIGNVQKGEEIRTDEEIFSLSKLKDIPPVGSIKCTLSISNQELGLTFKTFDDNELYFKGKATRICDDLELKVECVWTTSSDELLKRHEVECPSDILPLRFPPFMEKAFPISVPFNLSRKIKVLPRPEELWRNLPSKQDAYGAKPDENCDWIPSAELDKTLVAASVRGRSHAHIATWRDDHFVIKKEGDWFFMAVADGAGSYKFSRMGSRLACEGSFEVFQKKIADFDKLAAYLVNPEISASGRAVAERNIKYLLGVCFFNAIEKIRAEAKRQNNEDVKNYSTTLLVAIAKKIGNQWVTASAWVGDGAVVLIKQDNTAELLGRPDEGEFSGQTYFITMNNMRDELFGPKAIEADEERRNAFFDNSKRYSVNVVDDFRALMLMTDGITDPIFETTQNLVISEKWIKYLNELEESVRLDTRKKSVAARLVENISFYSPGNHDDRTLAILY